MAKMADFICTEQSYPAMSSKLLDDHRRLLTYLKQEERFMPNNYQMRRSVDDNTRTKMLESIYEVRLFLQLFFFPRCVWLHVLKCSVILLCKDH